MHRPMREGDRLFILSSWSRSFIYSHWAGPFTDEEYWPVMRAKLPGILDNPAVKVTVVCNPADEDQVFGWACYTPSASGEVPALHYIYVKHSFRDHQGAEEKPRLAIKLLRELGMADGKRFNYTFRTRAFDKFAQTWRLNSKFAPELIRGNKGGKEERA